MPNWCENTLTITGKPRNIRRFFARAFGSTEVEACPMGGNFIRHMLPNPFLDSDGNVIDREKNGDAWYQWEHQNYGCKWGASDTLFILDGGTLSVQFNSPWGPPDQAIITLSRKFPSLTFHNEYSESGNGFVGEQTSKAGLSASTCRDMNGEDRLKNNCADDEVVLASLVKKLHPARFSDMSPRMAAYVAYLLGQNWTTPSIGGMAVTSDGYLICDGEFHGAMSDFDDNLRNLVQVIGDNLYDQEIMMLADLYRQKVLDYRPRKGIAL